MIQFLNPILLAGAAAVVVPIVLHLLSRSRFRSVDWGGMMFLPGRDWRRRQASRLRQWTLLIARCAILGGLAFAMALPRVHAGHNSGPALAIIILDRSASMGMVENERSRMDRAREAATNVLAGLRPGDQAALIDAAGNENVGVTSDLQLLAQQILGMNVADAQANFSTALLRAAAIGRAHPEMKPRIFIVSDRQANNWQGMDAEFVQRWKKDRSLPIAWIPVGGKNAENVAIDSVQLLSPPVIEGLASEMAVQVHNYGPSARGPVHLSLTDNGQKLAETDLTLAAREDRRVVLPVRFTHAGEVKLTVAINAADLASDNVRPYVVNVTERLPVLIISGDQRLGHFRREADFLKLALAPFSTSTTKPTEDMRNPCIVRVVDADQWTPQMFDGQRVVILANVPALSSDEVRSLEQFTYTGGGVIIAPGNLVRAEDYNQTLYRNATGISPAALQAPTSADAAPTALLGIDLSHPIFQFLKGTPDPIPQATIARYFPANPHGGDVRVLSSYATGEPFVVEGAFGHGHVLLVTTPLDADWSNLPLSNFYLPFVQSCVKYLCAAGQSRRELEPEEKITGSFAGDVDERSVRIVLPRGHMDSCEVSPLGDRLEFRYGPVSEAGEYVVKAASPHGEEEQSFIVTSLASESDLTPLDNDEIRHLHDALGVDVLFADAHSVQRAGATDFSLWLGGIALVLALAVGEMFLASVWGQGRMR
jgi:Aerotolerance regulator N-terminal/von Willebrand factor type A domain